MVAVKIVWCSPAPFPTLCVIYLHAVRNFALGCSSRVEIETGALCGHVTSESRFSVLRFELTWGDFSFLFTQPSWYIPVHHLQVFSICQTPTNVNERLHVFRSFLKIYRAQDFYWQLDLTFSLRAHILLCWAWWLSIATCVSACVIQRTGIFISLDNNFIEANRVYFKERQHMNTFKSKYSLWSSIFLSFSPSCCWSPWLILTALCFHSQLFLFWTFWHPGQL